MKDIVTQNLSTVAEIQLHIASRNTSILSMEESSNGVIIVIFTDGTQANVTPDNAMDLNNIYRVAVKWINKFEKPANYYLPPAGDPAYKELL